MALARITCRSCTKKFTPTHVRHVRCAPCRSSRDPRPKPPRKPPTYAARACDHCGVTYTPAGSTSRYCGEHTEMPPWARRSRTPCIRCGTLTEPNYSSWCTDCQRPTPGWTPAVIEQHEQHRADGLFTGPPPVLTYRGKPIAPPRRPVAA